MPFISRAKKSASPAVYKPTAPSSAASSAPAPSDVGIPTVDALMHNRDWTGAVTVLAHTIQHRKSSAAAHFNANTLAQLAYAYFHQGDYERAANVYEQIVQRREDGADQSKREYDDDDDADDVDDPAAADATPTERYRLYAAACYYALGNVRKADDIARRFGGNDDHLALRIRLHCAHRTGDEKALAALHAALSRTPSVYSDMSEAALLFSRHHWQEATDIYKKRILNERTLTALQVFVAMCYYKLDYYDVALDIVAPYIAQYPDSAAAVNLKACCHYKLYDGHSAESELKSLTTSLQRHSVNGTVEEDHVRHNLVVFRNGENALSVLPPLLDVFPEAKLNLIIYYLRHGQVDAAYNIANAMVPATPNEYIIKGVVAVAMGQATDNKELLKSAQQNFQLVGASASECDTIPGRQCMASCFFLLKQFDDVLIYLNSVRSYSFQDSVFNLNHGIALVATGAYKDALDALLLVTAPPYNQSYVYQAHLAKCFVRCGQPLHAWELYLRADNHDDSYDLLVVIAAEAYAMGEFYYSAKAYDVLERLETSSERADVWWSGKRGAISGVLQQIIDGRIAHSVIREMCVLLDGAVAPEAAEMAATIRRWSDAQS